MCIVNISILQVLRDMAVFHACFLGKTDELLEHSSLEEVVQYAADRKPKSKLYLLRALGEVARSFGAIVTPKRKRLVENLISHFEQVYKEVKQQPFTLVHYDPHPGNENAWTKYVTYLVTYMLQLLYRWILSKYDISLDDSSVDAKQAHLKM